MNELKYVMFKNDEFLLLPKYVAHKDVEIKGRTVVSAGFVRMADEDNLLHCYGKSDSLGIESRSEKDTKIITTALCV